MISENKKIYAEIANRIREIPPEKYFFIYGWEELVQKLCESDDSRLHDIGVRERDKMDLFRPINNK